MVRILQAAAKRLIDDRISFRQLVPSFSLSPLNRWNVMNPMPGLTSTASVLRPNDDCLLSESRPAAGNCQNDQKRNWKPHAVLLSLQETACVGTPSRECRSSDRNTAGWTMASADRQFDQIRESQTQKIRHEPAGWGSLTVC